ncbi:MAG: hypothetical protein ABEL51_05105 [Salinibacter sp.]
MPEGHFTIGDLSFSFEGDLKELAHCQEIIREIHRAERRLRRAAGAEEVFLVYDRDLEGERGTFDKMRLRAYDDAKNYTLDLGVTDNNPLGIYVGYDQNIEVYDREEGTAWQIDPEGNRVEGGEEDEAAAPEETTARQGTGASQAQPSAAADRSAQATQPSSASEGEGASQAEIERAAEALRQRVRTHAPDQLVGETTIPDGPLGEKLHDFARYCGRTQGYLHRVLDAVGVSTVGNLAVGQVPDVIDMMKDEEVLRQNESFEPDTELPF